MVWDARTGDVCQQFDFHKAPMLDVDWRSSSNIIRIMFVHVQLSLGCLCCVSNVVLCALIATTDCVVCVHVLHEHLCFNTSVIAVACSTDKMIYVCEVGKNKPVKQFAGHQDEVNAIKWDPSGTLLASWYAHTFIHTHACTQVTCITFLLSHNSLSYNLMRLHLKTSMFFRVALSPARI